MENRRKTSKLPAKTESRVVDVSLKHIAGAFTTLFVGVFIVGSGIMIIRDYTKYKRQKALLEGTIKIIEKFKS